MSDQQFFDIRKDVRDQAMLNHKYFELGLYTDCTLIAKCGRFVNAHRIVLSASSDFLAKVLLLRSSDPNPIIILPTATYEDLKRAVDFIYCGSITLHESELDGFNQIVSELNIINVLPGSPRVVFDETLRFERKSSSSQSSSDSQSSSSSSDGASESQGYKSLESTPCVRESPAYENPPNVSSSHSSSSTPHSSAASYGFKLPANPVQILEDYNFDHFMAKPNFPEIVDEPPEKPKSKPKPANYPKRIIPVNLNNKFICTFCGKARLKNLKSLQNHQRICLENPERRIFRCSICSRTFSRNCRLTEHMEKTHENAN